MISLILYTLAGMVAVMALTWVVYRVADRPDIVDVVWAFSLAAAGIAFSVWGEGWHARRVLLGGLVGFWGLRLGMHLLVRVSTHPEDGRYVEMRRKWQTNIPARFFMFFQFQALLNVVLAVPFAVVAQNSHPTFHILEWLAMALYIVSVVGESIADHQLREFKLDPSNRGKVCQSGLWRYSRHPNYFFEWLVWVAYFLLAITAPWGWLSLAAPILMLYFLLKVTGIPATEEQSVRSKGEAYILYQQTTSKFVPWFRREETA